MGVAITDLLLRKEIEINDLKNKTIAIDGNIFLYQFLTSIRGRDGTPLMDSSGSITSHLTGLFNRTIKLMTQGLKLIYIFDGKPSELKNKERERRKNLKLEAKKKYEEAKQKQDLDEMKKYAARTSRLTSEMVDESRELLKSLGIPVFIAPSEGEAQASYLVKKDIAYAVASQDADCLMFQAQKLIRNLSIAGKRKKTNKLAFETINPEEVNLIDNLNHLAIDQEQLIALCMLVGTDYNLGGIKGIGPKNALKLVKEYGNDFDSLFKKVEWDTYFSYPWSEVYYTIKKMNVTDEFDIKWNDVDENKVKEILVEKHDFNEERIESSLQKLLKGKKEKQQKSLMEF